MQAETTGCLALGFDNVPAGLFGLKALSVGLYDLKVLSGGSEPPSVEYEGSGEDSRAA